VRLSCFGSTVCSTSGTSVVVEITTRAIPDRGHSCPALFAVPVVLVLWARQNFIDRSTHARRLHGQQLPVKHVVVAKTLAEEELAEEPFQVVVVWAVVKTKRAHVLKV
jgi:hypothetical protein